ncbi:Arsb, partial [Symbiodinium microadriaticum]
GAVDHFHKTVGLACYPPGRDSHEDLHWSHCKINNGYDLQENGTPFLDQTTYAGFLQTTQAVSAIMAHDPSQPMLMHFHTNAPHTPLQVPDELFRLCENVSTGDPSSRPQDRQIICGMVASVDMGVLQLLLALAKKDMLASTLIVYHSDNGGVVGSGSLNRPFRGQKATLFEGGIRVPAFMYGNGLHTAHRLTPERADLVHVSDMLPTLLAYAGLRKRRHPFDGYDHWRRLVKGRPLHRMHVPVNSGSSVLDYFSAYIETIVDQNGAAVNWKYAHNPSAVEFYMLDVHGEEYVPEGEFLFDLSADPAEEVNYAHDTRFRPLLEYMRLRVVNVQDHSAPSQLDRMPPLVHIAPPSPLGCWLPEDSMQYRTFVCPITIHFDNEVGELMRMYEDEKEERGKASNRSQLFAH